MQNAESSLRSLLETLGQGVTHPLLVGLAEQLAGLGVLDRALPVRDQPLGELLQLRRWRCFTGGVPGQRGVELVQLCVEGRELGTHLLDGDVARPREVLFEGLLGLAQGRDELSEGRLGLLHGLRVELGVQVGFELGQAVSQFTHPVEDTDGARGVSGDTVQQRCGPVGELVDPVREPRRLGVQLGDAPREGPGAAREGTRPAREGSRRAAEFLRPLGQGGRGVAELLPLGGQLTKPVGEFPGAFSRCVGPLGELGSGLVEFARPVDDLLELLPHPVETDVDVLQVGLREGGVDGVGGQARDVVR